MNATTVLEPRDRVAAGRAGATLLVAGGPVDGPARPGPVLFRTAR